MGAPGLNDAYSRGCGPIPLPARACVVEEGKGKAPSILITEVPFQVSRDPLVKELAKLVKNDRVSGISTIRDESSTRSGGPVRIVIELKRGTDPHLVLNQLYQFSKLP